MLKNAPAYRQAGICCVRPAYKAGLLTGHLPVKGSNEG
jgi:hypothetical protein